MKLRPGERILRIHQIEKTVFITTTERVIEEPFIEYLAVPVIDVYEGLGCSRLNVRRDGERCIVDYTRIILED